MTNQILPIVQQHAGESCAAAAVVGHWLVEKSMCSALAFDDNWPGEDEGEEQ